MEINEKLNDELSKNSNWKNRFKFSPGAILLIFFQLISGMGGYSYILSMPIYMSSILRFSDTVSTTIYHAKSGIGTITNIFGAMLADSFLGRSKTYLCFAPVNIVLILAISIMAIYTQTEGIIVCYFLLAIFGGLVGPAIRTIIADQIPSDNKVMLSTYMHIIYFTNNFGVIIIAYVAPIMHKDIYCFGIECYPLVFSVAFLLSFLALITFLVGICFKLFTIYKPTENLLLNIFKCIHFALKKRKNQGKPPKNQTWLDYSKEKFDEDFINDIKIAKGLLIFLLAHPLFWTVFEQISSIWTLQAQYMNGMIGQDFVIKADQMQTLNPILVVLFIPIFELIVYPCLNRINFKVPYRIVTGQFFTALACVAMIFIQLRIDSIVDEKPLDNVQYRMLNLANGNLFINYDSKTFPVPYFDPKSFTFKKNSNFIMELNSNKINISTNNHTNKYLTAIIYFDNNNKNDNNFTFKTSEISIQKNGGYTNVRLFDFFSSDFKSTILLKAKVGLNKDFLLTGNKNDFGNYVKCGIGLFEVILKTNNDLAGKKLGEIRLFPAESKTIIIYKNQTEIQFIDLSEIRLMLPSILWQIIPYVLVTLGEVFFNVNTGIFLYGEAPLTMKSILLAAEYFCIALGNILILALKQILSNVSTMYLFVICGILVLISGIMTSALGYFYLKNKSETELSEKSDQNLTKL